MSVAERVERSHSAALLTAKLSLVVLTVLRPGVGGPQRLYLRVAERHCG